MILDRKTLESILTGALEFGWENNGLAPERFTAAQRANIRERSVEQPRDMASVALDFYTDARWIRLEAGTRKERKVFVFDLLEDGVLTASVQSVMPEEGDVPFVTVEFPLTEGEKRVTLYLPWDRAARIRRVELPDGASVRPYVHRRSFVAFGDSITHGCYAAHPSMTYVSQLARLLDARVINQGIGGEFMCPDNLTPGTYPRFDFVTIAYGTNDYRHGTREEFDREMPEFLRRAAAEFPNTPIFVILPLWRLQEGQGKIWEMGRTLEEVRSCIRQEAAKYPNMYLVEGAKLVPHLPEFYGDKFPLHPNDLGFGQYAMNLYREILPVLERQEKRHVTEQK